MENYEKSSKKHKVKLIERIKFNSNKANVMGKTNYNKLKPHIRGITVLTLVCFVFLQFMLAPFMKMIQAGGAGIQIQIGKAFANPFYRMTVSTVLVPLVIALIFGIILHVLMLVRSKLYRDITQKVVNNKRVDIAENIGTHGTAEFLDGKKVGMINENFRNFARDVEKREAEDLLAISKLEEATGLVFGTIIGNPYETVHLPYTSDLNRNVAVYGGSGSGKSRKFIRTNMLQLIKAGESMIVTDPKGELADSMGGTLKKSGYDVKVLNLVNQESSDTWNILDIVTSNNDADTFAQVIMDNTTSGVSKDAFWDRTEKNLIKALALYTIEQNISPKSMSTFYSVLTGESLEKLTNSFDSHFRRYPDSQAKIPWNIFNKAEQKVKEGTLIGLSTRLQIFQSSNMRRITEKSEIDLTKPGREKCAYFLVIPDSEATYNFIAGLFFSFSFIKLMNFADSQENHVLPTRVTFLLDELPNVAKIYDLDKKMATIRSRGISAVIIFQLISQFVKTYGESEMETILGNCDSHLFLGVNNMTTCKAVSEMIGKTTVKTESYRFDSIQEKLLSPINQNISESFANRNLITPEELRYLPVEECILIPNHMNPLKLQKYDFMRHPLSYLPKENKNYLKNKELYDDKYEEKLRIQREKDEEEEWIPENPVKKIKERNEPVETKLLEEEKEEVAREVEEQSVKPHSSEPVEKTIHVPLPNFEVMLTHSQKLGVLSIAKMGEAQEIEYMNKILSVITEFVEKNEPKLFPLENGVDLDEYRNGLNEEKLNLMEALVFIIEEVHGQGRIGKKNKYLALRNKLAAANFNGKDVLRTISAKIVYLVTNWENKENCKEIAKTLENNMNLLFSEENRWGIFQ